MKFEQFISWKFKEVEGKLKGFQASDVYTSKYTDKKGQTWKVTYDITNNTATIKLSDMFSLETGKTIACSLQDFVKTLKENGMYEERFDNRHSSSTIPWEGSFN